MYNNELNDLINNIISKNGAKGDDKNKAKVEKMLKGLSPKQAKQLKSVLSDPKKSADILNSPAAKALFKKLSE